MSKIFFNNNIFYPYRSKRKSLRSNDEILKALEEIEDDFDDQESLEDLSDDSFQDKNFTLGDIDSIESSDSEDSQAEDGMTETIAENGNGNAGVEVDGRVDENGTDTEDKNDSDDASQSELPASWQSNIEDIDWSTPSNEFRPLVSISKEEKEVVLCPLNRSATPFGAFKCLYPYSLFVYIAEKKTNKKIAMANKSKKTNNQYTDTGEIMILLACTMIMGYNKVPHLQLYWSGNSSLKNDCISIQQSYLEGQI